MRHEETVAAMTDVEVVPLIEEELQVGKRLLHVGTVRLHKHTEQRLEAVEVPLTDSRWHVEHVPVGRVVTEREQPRQEGDTTIYPIFEERLVVTRELVLREEVHVTRVETTRNEVTEHTLLREVLAVERSAE